MRIEPHQIQSSIIRNRNRSEIGPNTSTGCIDMSLYDFVNTFVLLPLLSKILNSCSFSTKTKAIFNKFKNNSMKGNAMFYSVKFIWHLFTTLQSPKKNCQSSQTCHKYSYFIQKTLELIFYKLILFSIFR